MIGQPPKRIIGEQRTVGPAHKTVFKRVAVRIGGVAREVAAPVIGECYAARCRVLVEAVVGVVSGERHRPVPCIQIIAARPRRNLAGGRVALLKAIGRFDWLSNIFCDRFSHL